jgi:HEPN domain-containing protein
MNDKKKYWLEIAEYDFETARVMLQGRQFLYVGFMCHQTMEKILKAFYVSKLQENPPHKHNYERCEGIVKKAEGLYQWIKDQL